MIPRAALAEAGRTHRKIITKGLNYMASDPLQSTFREVPILDQALDVLLANTMSVADLHDPQKNGH